LSIRDKLSKNQPIVIGIAAVAIIVGITSSIWQYRNANSSSGGGAYFTVDDGKTLFVDKALKMAPFDKDGKQAVRAHVFMCGGKQVVGYLSRYSADALQTLAEAKAASGQGKPPPNIGKLSSIGFTGTEYKKPGDATWIAGTDSSGIAKIRAFKCPDGKAPTDEVRPE
jgi:hypothetical protein